MPSFKSNQTVWCPVCAGPNPGHKNPHKLDCIGSNGYHDLAQCPDCKGVYEITYKVDQILRLGVRF